MDSRREALRAPRGNGRSINVTEQEMNRNHHGGGIKLLNSPLNASPNMALSKTLWVVVVLAILAYAVIEFGRTSKSGLTLADKQSAFIRFLIALVAGAFAGLYAMSS